MFFFKQCADGTYIAGGEVLRTLSDFPGSVRARKRPIPIVAIQLKEETQVETPSGVSEGKPGDWLMHGVSGELYVCPASVFKKSYDIIGK